MSDAATTPGPAVPREEPLLRTLAPALRELERRLRGWLALKPHRPLTTLQRARLDGLAGDLDRQAQSLQQEQPLLVVMLMGGTGVGKSTLLNALAGGSIAHASFARPTTRDPVVYYHHSVKPDRLDPALQFCKLVAHDRPELALKILVDTPDVDSNDLANRDKLRRLLPAADVVLFVGSPEKYHDRLMWDEFLKARRRHAFAFVLNKWDRGQHPGASGRRPDEDLLDDLHAEHFEKPLLFRTVAQHWVDHPLTGNGQPTLPFDGEQFPDLVDWLEHGLARLEIDAIKTRGVSQLLRQLDEGLAAVCPPDLNEPAGRVEKVWDRLVDEEARTAATVLLNTLEPYRKEIEHHFAQERLRKFTGMMALYLEGFNRLRYAGSSLRDRLPLTRGPGTKVERPRDYSLSSFTHACTAAASQQHLDARLKALSNRLLIDADGQGMPLALLTEPTEAVALLDWRGKYAEAITNILGDMERSWTEPIGMRKWLQRGLLFVGDWLPLAACAAMGTILLWQYTMERREFHWGDLLLPAVVLLLVLFLLHVLIALLLPLRWGAIRYELESKLQTRLRDEMHKAYAPIPRDVADLVLAERRQVEDLLKETREVAQWLAEREQAASILHLYGRAP